MSTPTTIPLSSVVEGTRARNSKKYGDISALAQSIRNIGLIQPIVLSARPDGRFDLVAGGRRYRALCSIGVVELTHGITLRPGSYGFIFESEVPEHSRREAELEENLHRLDMDWVDEVLLVDDIHKLKVKTFGPSEWGQSQTAALLGYSGNSAVATALAAAKLLRAGDKEALSCTSLKEITQLRMKRKEDEALAELHKRLAAKQGTGTQIVQPAGAPTTTSTSSFLDSLSLDLGGPKTSIPTISLSTPVQDIPSAVVPLSSMLRLGDSIRVLMPALPDASFSHIVTDIPYGIDMDNLDLKNQESVAAEHEVQANVDQIPDFLSQSFRLLQPGGFLVFFFDLDHWNLIQATAKAIGFKVQDWPLIACKTSACRNQAAAYNTTKNYESFCFLRRDSTAVLRHDSGRAFNNSSWKAYDFASERALYNNPFAKPFELWKDIFDMIAFPGQSILDPFAGECSSLRAAANCGLAPNGMEISEVHYNRGLENMKKVYAVIHKSNVSFV